MQVKNKNLHLLITENASTPLTIHEPSATATNDDAANDATANDEDARLTPNAPSTYASPNDASSHAPSYGLTNAIINAAINAPDANAYAIIITPCNVSTNDDASSAITNDDDDGLAIYANATVNGSTIITIVSTHIANT